MTTLSDKLSVDGLATSSGVAIRSSSGAMVAVVKHTPGQDMQGSQCEAFANLFAAAPRLLASLATLVDAIPKDGGMIRFDGDELAAARAAVASARGAA